MQIKDMLPWARKDLPAESRSDDDSPIASLQREMNRVFDSFWSGAGRPFGNLPAELTAEESGWVDGFRQIQKKLVNILTEQGLTPIRAEGEFDPNLHEAITSEPHDDIESGHIIQTLRAGYEYKGRVLRPAMVRVAS